MVRVRRTCLKWKVVEGVRVWCRLPYGHPRDQPCTPQAQIKAAARRAEIDRLILDHDDSACDLCAGYVAAVERGAVPDDAISMRCEWGQSLQTAVERVHQGRGGGVVTVRPVTVPDLSRFAFCHLCQAAAGQPCRDLRVGVTGQFLARPHPERMLAVARDDDGVMILGRKEHVTSSRPGTTHSAYAHHAVVHNTAVCNGTLIADETYAPLPRLSNRERCQRPACKRIWRNEEDSQ